MNMNYFKGYSTYWMVDTQIDTDELHIISVEMGSADRIVAKLNLVEYQNVYANNQIEANAALIAASTDLLKACMDYENPTSQTVADCLRELSSLLPQNESKWIEWCDKQADVIESAITKALTI